MLEQSSGRWLHELLLAARFAVVGVGATLIHIAVVWLLLGHSQLPAHGANVLAFICAFGWSFTGNYFWTFRQASEPWQALRRFALIAVLGFLLNSLIFTALLYSQWLPAQWSAVVAAAFVPVLSFLASRLWAFNAP